MQLFHDFLGKVIAYCHHNGLGNEAAIAERVQRDVGSILHIDPEAVMQHAAERMAAAVDANAGVPVVVPTEDAPAEEPPVDQSTIN